MACPWASCVHTLRRVDGRVSAHEQIKKNQDLHQLLVLLMSLLLLFSSLSHLCALCVSWHLVHRACNNLIGLNLLDSYPTALNELLELILLVIMNAVLTLKLFLCKLLLGHLEWLCGCAWSACACAHVHRGTRCWGGAAALCMYDKEGGKATYLVQTGV